MKRRYIISTGAWVYIAAATTAGAILMGAVALAFVVARLAGVM